MAVRFTYLVKLTPTQGGTHGDAPVIELKPTKRYYNKLFCIWGKKNDAESIWQRMIDPRRAQTVYKVLYDVEACVVIREPVDIVLGH